MNAKPLHELIDEYRLSMTRVEEARPCACGRIVIADPNDPTAGVSEHQHTAHHQRWSSLTYGHRRLDADRRALATATTKAYKANLRRDVERVREERRAARVT